MHILLFKEIKTTTEYHFHSSRWQKVKGLITSIGSDVCLRCQWEYKVMCSHLVKQFDVLSIEITNAHLLLTPQFRFLKFVPKKPSHACRRRYL